MKATIKLLAFILAGSTIATSCKKDDVPAPPAPVVFYETQDQMARPAINTVFNVAAADKDAYNVTTPSAQGAAFQSKFQARLLGLNAGYTTNALGQSATAFTTLLATDVLGASTTGKTTFFDGVAANTLSGRALADDVIDVELILIFGGPGALTGSPTNTGLISDNVSTNDKAFLTSFPYLATPF
jgi:hypothetical protein